MRVGTRAREGLYATNARAYVRFLLTRGGIRDHGGYVSNAIIYDNHAGGGGAWKHYKICFVVYAWDGSGMGWIREWRSALSRFGWDTVRVLDGPLSLVGVMF